jgi:hypothetical protein
VVLVYLLVSPVMLEARQVVQRPAKLEVHLVLQEVLVDLVLQEVHLVTRVVLLVLQVVRRVTRVVRLV